MENDGSGLLEEEQSPRGISDGFPAQKPERFAKHIQTVAQRDVIKQVHAKLNQPTEHDIIGRNEFQDEMTPGQRGHQVADGSHREIGADKKMMNDGKGQNAVGPDPVQKGRPLGI